MTLAHLGSLRIKQERCQEALELFRSTIKIDPERVNAHASLGVVLANLNRYEEALDNLNWAKAFAQPKAKMSPFARLKIAGYDFAV